MENLIVEPFYKRFRKALAVRDMKQVDIVNATKIPKGSLSQYYTGFVEPKSDRVYLIAKALDVNPVWLMGVDAPMEVSKENDVTQDLLATVSKSADLRRLISYYLSFNDKQKETVLNLAESLTKM